MILFVVNPESGKGKGRTVWQEVEKYLIKHSIPHQVWYTKPENRSTSAICHECSRKEWQAVVAIGGDGTVNEVGSGVIGQNVPLGIIPTGTGNDFASAHQIPKHVKKALVRILNFQPKRVDTALVNGKPMLGSMGAGFDVDVVARTNQAAHKKWLGPLSYGLEAVKCLFSFQPQKMTLAIDGEKYQMEKSWMITVVNIRQYGGGIRICPHAKTDDGYLDICCAQNISKGQFLRTFPLAYFGWHTRHPAVRIFRGQKIEISGAVPFPYHIDGEVVGTAPVQAEVNPRSLLLL